MVNRVLGPRQEAEISPALRAYVDRAVIKALRDPVGRRDFALHADGGRVLPELTKVAKGGGWTQSSSGSSPEYAITDDSRIGHCWSIPGSAAQLGIQLSQMIFPTHVSIDHIPLEIAADIGQAPRTVVLWGALDGSVNESRRRHAFASSKVPVPALLYGRTAPKTTSRHKFILLGSFEYDIRGTYAVQTYPLDWCVVDSDLYFGVVVLEILDNWGGNATCLYRARVHGEPALT
ncbi:hypothetical protein K466DRAFT_504052 [Polyporus arcularius HHB13444]|uniref:SUN domain-containing protein n=1 Tax=Polyporus arcularius HHB13444 TaxID=1314778 RepID=A0A5C3NSN2_9APHY|nr:hypothetical protein K466DRAFT_504052 [Polyporus arcularius HHB13444]